MAEYRYLAYDLLTNALITELPLNGVSFESQINGFGGFDAQLFLSPADADKVVSQSYVAATQPQRTAIYVERDGSLVWGGIIWTRNYSPANYILAIGAGEFFSYFWRRTLNSTYTATAVEQFSIVRAFIDYAQGQASGNIGMLYTAGNSGVVRDRTYYNFERKGIGEAIHQLSAVINGFDYAVDVAYSGGVPTKTLTLSYPRRGRSAAMTGHVLEIGRNVVVLSWPEDGSGAANRVHAIGGGEGDAGLITTVSDTTVLDAGYPLLEDTISMTDVKELPTLIGHAQATLNAKSRPIVLPLITIRADLDPVFGAYILGDDVRVKIDDGLDPRFVGGLDVYRRIIGWRVTVPDEGATEDVTLTLGEVP